MKETKERIISEAAKLFMRQGFPGTSVAEIANEVGIAPSSLFSHYKSKEEIYEKVIEKYVINMQSPEKKFGDCSKMSLLEFIDCYVGVIKTQRKSLMEVIQGGERSHAQYSSFLLESSIRNEKSRNALVGFYMKEIDLWKSVIERARKAGEVRKSINVQNMAEVFQYSYSGVSYLLSIDDDMTLEKLEQVLMNIYDSIKVKKKEI